MSAAHQLVTSKDSRSNGICCFLCSLWCAKIVNNATIFIRSIQTALKVRAQRYLHKPVALAVIFCYNYDEERILTFRGNLEIRPLWYIFAGNTASKKSWNAKDCYWARNRLGHPKRCFNQNFQVEALLKTQGNSQRKCDQAEQSTVYHLCSILKEKAETACMVEQQAPLILGFT